MQGCLPIVEHLLTFPAVQQQRDRCGNHCSHHLRSDGLPASPICASTIDLRAGIRLTA